MPRIASIDSHIGARLRARRILRHVSQAELAKVADLSFQQIQKYENGTNRISASLLYKFSQFLDVEIAYFYEQLPADAPAGEAAGSDGPVPAADGDPMARRETLLLVSAYYSIESDEVRRCTFDMIRELGGGTRRAASADRGQEDADEG
jgi:transcriptional regulator with XRE-family HTH domain